MFSSFCSSSCICISGCPGQEDDWVLSWHPKENLFLYAPISIRIEVRKTFVLAQYHSRPKAWGTWMSWTLAMLSWTQPDSTGLHCFRECLQEVVSVLPWFHHWVWLTQTMKGWVIPESALPSYKCVSLAPSRMVPKAHFYYRRMHWILTYGKTAFKSTSLLPHMSCERGKGKLVITIDFLTYSQIIAFDYEQGQLQEWLFHLYLVCFGIRTMDGVLGCNYCPHLTG